MATTELGARRTGCALCPRVCGARRTDGERGICGETSTVRLARAALHMWEEPPISGSSGSGTVFFSGCPLRCVYCQNKPVSRSEIGLEISVERLAEVFLEQQQRGALNINLVTPTHFVPQIIDALDMARAAGLVLPVIYNTSGYESPDTLDLLEGYINIYLTDYKYADRNRAACYSAASDYPDVASRALDVMFSQVGPYAAGPDPRPIATRTTHEDEVLVQGVVVRHLMLPGGLEDSKAVMRILAAKPYSANICVSIMSQYTPVFTSNVHQNELLKPVDLAEYDALVNYALELGLVNSYMQEGGSVGESFIPDFDCQGVAYAPEVAADRF